jgi:hypothetical protein
MYGRILRCPRGGNPLDCPLHDIRLLPVVKRIEWLESMNDEELERLYGYHRACLEVAKSELAG